MDDDPLLSLAFQLDAPQNATIPRKTGPFSGDQRTNGMPKSTSIHRPPLGVRHNPPSGNDGMMPGVIPIARPPPSQAIQATTQQRTFRAPPISQHSSGNFLASGAGSLPSSSSSKFPTGVVYRGYKDHGQGSLIQRHSGLKVKNPLISSSQLEARFDAHSVLKLSLIRKRHQNSTLQGAWATIAVIGENSGCKESASGKTYSIWKLTDLDETSVSLFLFGRADEELRRDGEVGALVALFTPKIRSEGGGDFSMSVERSDQVLLLGKSSEFAYCGATQKNGRPCRVPVNVSRCAFCTYHVANEYKKLQPVTRIELQGNQLKSAFQPGMQRTLHWQHGKFQSADAPVRPRMPAATTAQLKEAAAAAAASARGGSSSGARYVRTVADPAAAKTEAQNIELVQLRRNKLTPGAAPIPQARTSVVVYEGPSAASGGGAGGASGGGASRGRNKRGLTAPPLTGMNFASNSLAKRSRGSSGDGGGGGGAPTLPATAAAADGDGGGGDDVMIDLEEDDLGDDDELGVPIAPPQEQEHQQGGSGGSAAPLLQTALPAPPTTNTNTNSTRRDNDARQRALEVLKLHHRNAEITTTAAAAAATATAAAAAALGGRNSGGTTTTTTTNAGVKRMPEFLAAPLRHRQSTTTTEEAPSRQQQGGRGGSSNRRSDLSAAMTAAAAPGPRLNAAGFIAPLSTSTAATKTFGKRERNHSTINPGARSKFTTTTTSKKNAAPSSFAAAFGGVIAEMEAAAASDPSAATGSLYKEAVEEADADQLFATMAVLEKRDEMAQKMDSVKTLSVTAWKCAACNCTLEYRPKRCWEQHPRELSKVQVTKRWWQCEGCKKRFTTVGQRYPTGRCPKCDAVGVDFTSVSMLQPQRKVEHEAQQGKVAGREMMVARGAEQKWLNQ